MDPSWEGLFADLEAQFDAQERRELDAEVADRTRRERALVELRSRLLGHVGRPVDLRLVTGRVLRGRLDEVGDDWLLVGDPGPATLVVAPAVTAFIGLSARPADTTAARRFGLGSVLRGLARDRAPVRVEDRSGAVVTGTIDRVGSDHFDLAEHDLDEPRRSAGVRAERAVPYAALVTITR